jgi:hypothetical protein
MRVYVVGADGPVPSFGGGGEVVVIFDVLWWLILLTDVLYRQI